MNKKTLIKSTQVIIEEIGISLTKHNLDRVRDFTKEWVDLLQLKQLIVQFGYEKKSLLELYDFLQSLQDKTKEVATNEK